jgi:hypothetical protein
MQGNPRKSKEKSLDFLGFLWRNQGFSMGYGESKQKNLPAFGDSQTASADNLSPSHQVRAAASS